MDRLQFLSSRYISRYCIDNRRTVLPGQEQSSIRAIEQPIEQIQQEEAEREEYATNLIDEWHAVCATSSLPHLLLVHFASEQTVPELATASGHGNRHWRPATGRPMLLLFVGSFQVFTVFRLVVTVLVVVTRFVRHGVAINRVQINGWLAVWITTKCGLTVENSAVLRTSRTIEGFLVYHTLWQAVLVLHE